DVNDGGCPGPARVSRERNGGARGTLVVAAFARRLDPAPGTLVLHPLRPQAWHGGKYHPYLALGGVCDRVLDLATRLARGGVVEVRSISARCAGLGRGQPSRGSRNGERRRTR